MANTKSGVIEAWSVFLPYVRPHSGALLVAFFFMGVASLLKATLPMMARDILRDDAGVGANVSEYLIMGGLYVLYHSTSLLGCYWSGVCGHRVEADLVAAAMRKVCHGPYEAVQRESPEALASTILSAAAHAASSTCGTLTDIVDNALHVLFFSTALFSFSPPLLAVLGSMAVTSHVASKYLRQSLPEATERLVSREGNVSKLCVETLACQSTIRLFKLQAMHDLRIIASLRSRVQQNAICCWKTHAVGAILGFLNNATYIAILYIMRQMRDDGKIQAADLIAFMYNVQMWKSYVTDIATDLSKLGLMVGRTEAMRNLLLLQPSSSSSASLTVREKNAGRGLDSDEVLRLDNVSYVYGSCHASLSLRAGKLYGMVGYNGEGKTTLLRLMAGLYTPTTGVVCVRPEDEIVLCEQNASIFYGTIYDNIRIGNLSATPEMVYAAARQCNIHTTIEALPQGYHTEVKSGMEVSLSGGQIQRICLARVMLHASAKIVLLDEPTKGLDGSAAGQVMEVVHDLVVRQRRTVVIVTHSVKLLRSADCIFVVKKGYVGELGTHEELHRGSETYRGLQFDI